MNSPKQKKYFPVTLDDGISLRPVQIADAETIFDAIDASREHLSPWLPWVKQTKCVEDSRSFLLDAEKKYKQGTALNLGIFRKVADEKETCLGIVGFREIKTFERCAVLGFWMSVACQGSGLCTRACSKLIEYGESLGLRKFEIHSELSNKKSRAVAERLKFQDTPGLVCEDFSDPNQHVGYLLNQSDRQSRSFNIMSMVLPMLALTIAVAIGSIGLLRTPDATAPTMRGKHLLMVSGGFNFTVQGFWYDKAREMDIDISVADNPGHYAEKYATTNLVYSFHPVNLYAGEKELTKQLVNILKHSGIDFSGILTFKDAYLVSVAQAAKEMGLPTLDPSIYRTIRDKGSLRKATGSNVPHASVSSIADIPKAAKHVGFPCVMKPNFGEGSLAVVQVPTLKHLYESYNTVTASLPKLKNVIGGIPDIILEKQLKGTEHDVDIVIENGHLLFASVSDEHAMIQPWFQETGRTTPSKLDPTSQKKLLELVNNICTKAGITDGVFHLEFMYTTNGPELLEVNGRLGGLLVTHSVDAIWGVDLIKIAYTLAAGVRLPTLPTSGVMGGNIPSMVAVNKYPNVPFTGYITRTEFLSLLKKDHRVKVAHRLVNVGQHVFGAEDERPWFFGVMMMVDEGPIQKVEKDAEYLIQSIDWASYLSKTAPKNALEVANTPVLGMEDIFGLPRRKFLAVSRIFEEVAYRFGFDEVQVPLIERASTFSEEVVGQSPWPEWDKRGCFFFDVEDFTDGFGKLQGKTPVILVPEGTLSVARWLGHQIATNRQTLAFPLKIFYNMPCFRNEPVDTLSGRKKRQFDQFGVEILGTRHLGADVEIIWMLGKMMEGMGIPKSSVIARVSNVQILIRLLKDSKIAHPDDIRIKEAMDEIAECRAKGATGCVAKNEAAFWKVVDQYKGIPKELLTAWRTMLHHSTGIVNEDLRKNFPTDYAPLFDELEDISSELLKHGVRVVADLCVVRSHEYYTHFSFEVDVILNGKRYLEVAGGGRYDKLVGHFVQQQDNAINVVPSTGFAFGMQRLIAMLEDAKIFQVSKVWERAPKGLPLSDSTADYLLVPNPKCGDVNGYLQAQQWLLTKSGLNVTDVRVDTYIGDSWAGGVSPSALRDDLIADYLRKHNIPKQLQHPDDCTPKGNLTK